jgi:acetyl esterase/lipase
MVHGGSWDAGDPFQLDVERVCEVLADSGFLVFSGDYRLAPCSIINGQPRHAPSPSPSPSPEASGRPPEQTDDVMALMIAAKNDPRCNGKVGVIGSSVGGFLSLYAALYPTSISGSGRPPWTIAYRPVCLVTFSSPFDLGDQDPSNDPFNDMPYIKSIQNYIGTCSRSDARAASPIALIDSGVTGTFTPLLAFQGVSDPVNPPRQATDMESAFVHAGVDQCLYQILRVTESPYDERHALSLWTAPDPTGVYPTIGDRVVAFLHENLD